MSEVSTAPVTRLDQLDPNGRYSIADYLSWQFSEMVELIRGKIFKMSAPKLTHQRLSRNIFGELYLHFKGKSCQIFSAPIDVYLTPEGTEHATIVQPDIIVVCDPTKLVERGCQGAPDLVVEILSRSTAGKDLGVKYDLYESVGVREYWLVDPENQTVLQYALSAVEQAFELVRIRPYIATETLTSAIFPELKLDLTEVFQES